MWTLALSCRLIKKGKLKLDTVDANDDILPHGSGAPLAPFTPPTTPLPRSRFRFQLDGGGNDLLLLLVWPGAACILRDKIPPPPPPIDGRFRGKFGVVTALEARWRVVFRVDPVTDVVPAAELRDVPVVDDDIIPFNKDAQKSPRESMFEVY